MSSVLELAAWWTVVVLTITVANYHVRTTTQDALDVLDTDEPPRLGGTRRLGNHEHPSHEEHAA